MRISPYQNNIIDFRDRTAFVYNTELATSVLLFKQQEFNQAYAGIEKLRRDALNINFLNQKEQGKINQFNKEINDFFASTNGELGDLSQSGVVKQYTKMFDKIGQDPNLINRYRQDQKYQTELRSIYAKRDSKDPIKAGYHAMNHSNYEARLQNYIGADLDKDNVTVTPYNNFVDIDEELTTLIKKAVPVEEFSRVINENGYLIIDKYKGRDPKKSRAVSEKYLTGKGMTQLREETEYYHRMNGDPLYKENLYNEYVSNASQEYNQLYEQKKKLETASVSDPSNKEILQALSQTTERLGQLEVEKDTPFEKFATKSNDELINYATSLHVKDSIDKYTNSSSGYATSREIKMDPTYFKALELSETFRNNAWKRDFSERKLIQDGLEAGTATGPSVITADGKIVPEQILSTTTTQNDLRPMADALLESAKYTIFKSQNVFETGLSGLTQSDLTQEEQEYYKNPPRVPTGIIDELATYGEFNYKKDENIKGRVPQTLTGEQIAKKIITNQSEVLKNPFFNNNPFVIGFINASTQLKRDVTEADIPYLMEQAKVQVQTPGTNAYAAALAVENEKKILDRFIDQVGIDMSDGLSKDEKLRYEEFSNKYADFITYTNTGVTSLDTSLANAKQKVPIRQNAQRLITELMDIKGTPGKIPAGSVVVDPTFFLHDDFTQVQVQSNGMIKLSLNGNTIERLNKGRGEDDKYSSATIFLKDKNGNTVPHIIDDTNNTIEFYSPKYNSVNYSKLLPIILNQDWLPYSVNGKEFKLKKDVDINGQEVIVLLTHTGELKTIPGDKQPEIVISEITKILMQNGR
jgi:hypothetical protein